MEGVPEEVDIESLEEDIKKIEGVTSIHDIHVWALSMGKKALSAHLTAQDPHRILKVVTKLCHKKYKIYHTTIQIEPESDHDHAFDCGNDLH